MPKKKISEEIIRRLLFQLWWEAIANYIFCAARKKKEKKRRNNNNTDNAFIIEVYNKEKLHRDNMSNPIAVEVIGTKLQIYSLDYHIRWISKARLPWQRQSWGKFLHVQCLRKQSS